MRMRYVFGFVWFLLNAVCQGEEQGMSSSPLIIAHRGASAEAPENTLASIKLAQEKKTDWIEFDVRVTADGVLMLQHDKTLERFTGETAAFETLSLAEVERKDVGRWFGEAFTGEKMPSFAQAIEACLPEATPLIEQKTGSAEAYAAVLRDLNAVDRVVVQSFDWQFLSEIRELLPDLTIGALGDKEVTAEKKSQLEALKPEWVGWNQKYLTEAAISGFQESGYRVAVWTVNDVRGYQRFVTWGVDGIITDRPDTAREVAEDLAKPAQPEN